jgi:hypothetical protein
MLFFDRKTKYMSEKKIEIGKKNMELRRMSQRCQNETKTRLGLNGKIHKSRLSHFCLRPVSNADAESLATWPIYSLFEKLLFGP